MVLDVVRAELDLEGPLDLLDALDVRDSGTQASVAAEDPLLLISDSSGQWQVIEGIVDLCEATVRVIDILTEPLGTLVAEAKVLVY